MMVHGCNECKLKTDWALKMQVDFKHIGGRSLCILHVQWQLIIQSTSTTKGFIPIGRFHGMGEHLEKVVTPGQEITVCLHQVPVKVCRLHTFATYNTFGAEFQLKICIIPSICQSTCGGKCEKFLMRWPLGIQGQLHLQQGTCKCHGDENGRFHPSTGHAKLNEGQALVLGKSNCDCGATYASCLWSKLFMQKGGPKFASLEQIRVTVHQVGCKVLWPLIPFPTLKARDCEFQGCVKVRKEGKNATLGQCFRPSGIDAGREGR